MVTPAPAARNSAADLPRLAAYRPDDQRHGVMTTSSGNQKFAAAATLHGRLVKCGRADEQRKQRLAQTERQQRRRSQDDRAQRLWVALVLATCPSSNARTTK